MKKQDDNDRRKHGRTDLISCGTIQVRDSEDEAHGIVTDVSSTGLALETDTALALGKLKTFLVGLATELDTALPLILIELPPDREGLEYTVPVNLLHYVASTNRLHFDVREED